MAQWKQNMYEKTTESINTINLLECFSFTKIQPGAASTQGRLSCRKYGFILTQNCSTYLPKRFNLRQRHLVRICAEPVHKNDDS
jgi:hypothetical protein